MGCDIHSYAIDANGGIIEGNFIDGEPFGWRSYGLFGFLADVRNYSGVKPVSQPRGLVARQKRIRTVQPEHRDFVWSEGL